MDGITEITGRTHSTTLTLGLPAAHSSVLLNTKGLPVTRVKICGPTPSTRSMILNLHIARCQRDSPSLAGHQTVTYILVGQSCGFSHIDECLQHKENYSTGSRSLPEFTYPVRLFGAFLLV